MAETPGPDRTMNSEVRVKSGVEEPSVDHQTGQTGAWIFHQKKPHSFLTLNFALRLDPERHFFAPDLWTLWTNEFDP